MAMSPFEKALLKELQAIRKELHQLNNKKTAVSLDAPEVNLSIDGKDLSESLKQSERWGR